jgi:hypothetical protein
MGSQTMIKCVKPEVEWALGWRPTQAGSVSRRQRASRGSPMGAAAPHGSRHAPAETPALQAETLVTVAAAVSSNYGSNPRDTGPSGSHQRFACRQWPQCAGRQGPHAPHVEGPTTAACAVHTLSGGAGCRSTCASRFYSDGSGLGLAALAVNVERAFPRSGSRGWVAQLCAGAQHDPHPAANFSRSSAENADRALKPLDRPAPIAAKAGNPRMRKAGRFLRFAVRLLADRGIGVGLPSGAAGPIHSSDTVRIDAHQLERVRSL